MFRTCQYLRIVLAFKPTPQRNRNWPARTVLRRTPQETRGFADGFLLPWGENRAQSLSMVERRAVASPLVFRAFLPPHPALSLGERENRSRPRLRLRHFVVLGCEFINSSSAAARQALFYGLLAAATTFRKCR